MDTFGSIDPLADETHDYRAISYWHDGGVAEITSLVADDDADAIAQTRASVRDLSIDLWDGLRFVEHFASRLVATTCVLVITRALGGL